MSVKVTLSMRFQTIFVISSLSSVRGVFIILAARSDDLSFRWLRWLLFWLLYLGGKIHFGFFIDRLMMMVIDRAIQW